MLNEIFLRNESTYNVNRKLLSYRSGEKVVFPFSSLSIKEDAVVVAKGGRKKIEKNINDEKNGENEESLAGALKRHVCQRKRYSCKEDFEL